MCKQKLCYDTVQLCGMTVEADDTSDLPYPIFVLPQVNELRLADRTQASRFDVRWPLQTGDVDVRHSRKFVRTT